MTFYWCIAEWMRMLFERCFHDNLKEFISLMTHPRISGKNFSYSWTPIKVKWYVQVVFSIQQTKLPFFYRRFITMHLNLNQISRRSATKFQLIVMILFATEKTQSAITNLGQLARNCHPWLYLQFIAWMHCTQMLKLILAFEKLLRRYR